MGRKGESSQDTYGGMNPSRSSMPEIPAAGSSRSVAMAAESHRRSQNAPVVPTV